MGFALSKIKRRKLRTRSHSLADTIIKLPTIEEDATTDASSITSSNTSYITSDEFSFNDDSTLSSIHTDSLTSFAGNLSPPEIEFHENLKDGKMSLASMYWGRKFTRNQSGGDSKKNDGGGIRQQGRQLPATFSSKTTKEDITPPPKSKTKVTPPKKTLRSAINGPSVPNTSIPSLVSNTSYLMEDLTVEIDHEMNDEESTVMTIDILDGIYPFQRKSTFDSIMYLFGGLECIDTFNTEDVAEDDDIAMDSLFDDEGNEFAFERKPQEIVEFEE